MKEIVDFDTLSIDEKKKLREFRWDGHGHQFGLHRGLEEDANIAGLDSLDTSDDPFSNFGFSVDDMEKL